VADGSGYAAPTANQLGPNVRWERHPGESIFQLRTRTYGEAHGAIVAVTEDHVHVPPDWATRMIEAHRRHPEAAAIGGSVTNGASDSMMNWASFLIVQAPVAAPVKSGRAKRMSGAVNVSYKRSALESPDTFEGMGAIDVLHQRELGRRGAVLLNDDSIRVSHVQPLGFRDTTVLNFHAGRTISGFRRKRMDAVQVARILGAFFVPLARYVKTVGLLAPKGYGRHLIRCGPAMLWLLYAQGVGQFIGYVAGEGESPRKVL
ncbi:MAG: hypothetical protein WEC33_02050, partial [Dehalococcoidia bacterium]